VQRHAAADSAFAEALLREGVDTMLAGDVDTGKAILRDYIKVTIGFEKLGEATGIHRTSLIRMFGPRGNPGPQPVQRARLPAKARQGRRPARHDGAGLTDLRASSARSRAWFRSSCYR
jgi:hypothetical protein